MNKNSKYNYYVMTKDKDLLIYNTLNYSFSKILNKDLDKFDSSYNYWGNKPNVELAQAGVIIKEETNEQDLFNMFQLNAIKEKKLVITIVLTSACNFRCAYCFEENFSNKKSNISDENLETIISYVRKNLWKYNEVIISWFGGEPLLYPYVKELIDYATSQNLEIQFLQMLHY